MGGKNSKLKVGVAASIMAGIERVKRSARVIEDAVPCAMAPTMGAVHGAWAAHVVRRAPRRLTTTSRRDGGPRADPTDLDGVRRQDPAGDRRADRRGSRRSPRSAPRSLPSSTPWRGCSPVARGCVPGSSTGATGRPAAAPTRSCASRQHGVLPGRRSAPRRRHGPRATPDAVCRPPTGPWQRCTPSVAGTATATASVRCRDPRRRPLPHVVRRALRDLRTSCRGAGRGRHLFDAMRTQAHGRAVPRPARVGAWLGRSRPRRADRVRPPGDPFKSAKYTIEHPLRIGALVGGASDDDLEPLSDYGLALGEALRDDLLGIRRPGDRQAAGDDLREGKRTVLIALALEAASAEDRALVDSLLGRDDLDDAGVQAIRRVLVSTGAVEGSRNHRHARRRRAQAVGQAREAGVSTPARSRSSRRSSRSPPATRLRSSSPTLATVVPHHAGVDR